MNSFNHQPCANQSTLYMVVFTSRIVVVVVLALIFSFLLQPIDQALAEEVNEAVDSSVSSVVLKPIPIEDEVDINDDSTILESETEVVVENDEADTNTKAIDNSVPTHILAESNPTSVETENEIVIPDNLKTIYSEPSGDDSGIDSGTSTPNTTNSTTSTTIQVNNDHQTVTGPDTTGATEDLASSTTTEEVEFHATTSTPLPQDELVEVSDVDTDINEATSTNLESSEKSIVNESNVMSSTSAGVATSTENLDETIIVVDTSNRHQFNSNECITVGSGAFYCNESENTVKYADNGVFALPDSEGDREIFVRLEGKEVQISNNLVDDNSPYYDTKSERIVWHTLINDRYQIISYDLKNNESELLTDSTYNNMEPVADGEIILWQAWIKNNWEIVMSADGKINQLTNNNVHDVAPSIRGEYIVWQTQFADGWKVALFDKDTSEVEYLDGLNEAAMAENPRFVLVFDQIDNNGDISTVGYDFDTKAAIHLGSLPRELPDELPEPEKTNEKKALVQTKPSTKEADDSETDNAKPSAINPPIPTTSSTTASSTNSIDIPDVVISPLSLDSSSTSTVTLLNEPIIEEPHSASMVDIPDIVIPPYSTSTDEVSG